MKRHINFGSIEQFRSITKNVQHMSQYIGYDEENKTPIYDRTLKAPKIKVIASEKLHGTNASVCYSHIDGFWVQSRENIITPEKDNAGCAFAVEQNKDAWMSLINLLAIENDIDLNKNIISVYFEWAGGNIQKNSALSGLNKKAVIFQHFKVSPLEPNENEVAVWYETCINIMKYTTYVSYNKCDIYNIMDFPYYEIEIDFENPSLSQNELVKLVEETIEPNSPIGKQFGIDGNVGEGVVCTFMYKGSLHRFKVKGEKHSNSKVKTLRPVDDVKEQAKIDFANYACASFRLEQAWQNTFGIDNEKCEPSMKETGTFLRFVINDVIKEESDIMYEKGLEPKDVNSMISKIARTWFIEQLNSF